MSYKFYDLVWAHNFDSPTEKLVMLEIAGHADGNGKGWPKVKTIAGDCGISPRTVQRIIKKFAQTGLLTIQTEYRPNGGQTSNRYFITLPSLKSLAPNDRSVIGGVPSKSPHPQTAQCHRGDDTAVTPQELPREAKTEPLQTTEHDLRLPKSLKNGGGWIIQFLNDIPKYDHQMLVDELSEAISSGKITTTPQRWFFGLKRNYLKGSFCPLARPSKPKPRLEVSVDIDNNDKSSRMCNEEKQENINALKQLIRSSTVSKTSAT